MRFGLFTSLVALVLMMVGCTPISNQDPAQNARYHYLMGASALNENRPAEALKEFLRAAEIDPADPEIQAGLAEAYMRRQAYDKAEEHYLEALELSGGEPKSSNNLGALYLTMERYDEAIEEFRKAAENLVFDRSEVAWTGIGFAQFRTGNYPAAEQAYRKAIAANGRYFQAPFRLGELYYSQNRPVEAIQQFERAVKLAPNFVEGHYWLGLTYMNTQQPQRAKEAFRQVLKLYPQGERAKLAKQYLDILQ